MMEVDDPKEMDASKSVSDNGDSTKAEMPSRKQDRTPRQMPPSSESEEDDDSMETQRPKRRLEFPSSKKRGLAQPRLTERQQLALLKKKTESQALLLNVHKKNASGESPLHQAAIKGNLDIAKALIQQGARVNAVDNAGWTPLHEACNHGYEDIAELLLKSGANVNAPGCDADTPLHDASVNGHFEVAALLLKFGAKPNQKNKRGKTPIDVACDTEMEELLHASDRSKNSKKKSEKSEKRRPKNSEAIRQAKKDEVSNNEKPEDILKEEIVQSTDVQPKAPAEKVVKKNSTATSDTKKKGIKNEGQHKGENVSSPAKVQKTEKKSAVQSEKKLPEEKHQSEKKKTPSTIQELATDKSKVIKTTSVKEKASITLATKDVTPLDTISKDRDEPTEKTTQPATEVKQKAATSVKPNERKRKREQHIPQKQPAKKDIATPKKTQTPKRVKSSGKLETPKHPRQTQPAKKQAAPKSSAARLQTRKVTTPKSVQGRTEQLVRPGAAGIISSPLRGRVDLNTVKQQLDKSATTIKSQMGVRSTDTSSDNVDEKDLATIQPPGLSHFLITTGASQVPSAEQHVQEYRTAVCPHGVQDENREKFYSQEKERRVAVRGMVVENERLIKCFERDMLRGSEGMKLFLQGKRAMETCMANFKLAFRSINELDVRQSFADIVERHEPARQSLLLLHNEQAFSLHAVQCLQWPGMENVVPVVKPPQFMLQAQL